MNDFKHKKSLGQNFLKNKHIINKIIHQIDAKKEDLIIEIGPGQGAITSNLSIFECDKYCFELDERLKEYLNKYEKKGLEIIYEDFLKTNLKDFLHKKKYNRLFFVGNLPYYITTAIIKKIISESNPYKILIMIQKEVAQRYMAKKDSKEYSSISVFLQYHFNIKKIVDVSRENFEPVPKVDSIVLELETKNKIPLNNEEVFNKLVLDSFKYKRKNLKNNLKNYNLDLIEKYLLDNNLSLQSRAENLSIEDFVNISNLL